MEGCRGAKTVPARWRCVRDGRAATDRTVGVLRDRAAVQILRPPRVRLGIRLPGIAAYRALAAVRVLGVICSCVVSWFAGRRSCPSWMGSEDRQGLGRVTPAVYAAYY